MSISRNRAPTWTEDLRRADLRHPHAARSRDAQAATGRSRAKAARGRDGEARRRRRRRRRPRDSGRGEGRTSCSGTTRIRACSRSSRCRNSADQRFSYLADVPRRATKKFVRLADDEVRDVTLGAERDAARSASTIRAYELMAQPRRPQLPGRLRDRHRRPATRKLGAQEGAAGARRRRPTATKFSTTRTATTSCYDMATGPRREHHDDGAGVVRQRRRRPQRREAAAAGARLDDATAAPCCSRTAGTSGRCRSPAGAAVNLTGNGRKDAIRYRRRFALDPDETRASISRKPQYFSALRRVDEEGRLRAASSPASPGVQMLLWDDAAYRRLQKAREGATCIVSHARRRRDAARLYVTDASLTAGTQADRRPTRRSTAFTWSAGAQLVELHAATKGEQAAGVALPAGQLREGQDVPDDRLHLREADAGPQPASRRRRPTASTGPSTRATATPCCSPTSPTRSTIPGMSAVWCVAAGA